MRNDLNALQPRVPYGRPRRIDYTSHDGGLRLRTSVIRARSMHGRAIHPTEKPAAVLALLLEYNVPPGGVVLDPFAGSGSTLLTARHVGRRAIGIEASAEYCQRAADRLAAVSPVCLPTTSRTEWWQMVDNRCPHCGESVVFDDVLWYAPRGPSTHVRGASVA